MKHSDHPTQNYDFAPVASLLGKYNARDSEDSREQLDKALDSALTEIESSDKPPIPHADPELVKGLQSFLFETVLSILNEAGESVPKYLQSRVRLAVQKLNERMVNLRPKARILCSVQEIQDMFGLVMPEDKLREIVEEENESRKCWKVPAQIKALDKPVTIDEVKKIFEVVRGKVLGTNAFNPDFYLDRPEKHHLFWSPKETGQQCVIPFNYSMADYLRLHSPHNDAHLYHLNAIPEQSVVSYCDFMDERAFFEAVAVYAEWQMLEAAGKRAFIEDLHSQFSADRQRRISKNQLQDWLLNCRGHEFHLRSVRLMGDVITLFSENSFDDTVDEVTLFTGLSRDEVQAEVRKYYHFPGLGATYTVGFKKLKEHGIISIHDAFFQNNQVVTTWHQF